MDLFCCYARRRRSAEECNPDHPLTRGWAEDSGDVVVLRLLRGVLADAPCEVPTTRLFVEVWWHSREGSARRISRTPPQRLGPGRTLVWQHACPGQPYPRDPPELSPSEPGSMAGGSRERVVLHLVRDCADGSTRCLRYGSASVLLEELLDPDVKASSGGGRCPERQVELRSPRASAEGWVGRLTVQATLLFSAPCAAPRLAGRLGAAAALEGGEGRMFPRAVSPSSSSDEEAEAPASLVAASMLRHWSSGSSGEGGRGRQAAEADTPAAKADEDAVALGGEHKLADGNCQIVGFQELGANKEPKDGQGWNDGLEDVCNVPCFRGDPLGYDRAK
mmetsp:Transcript_25403/g.72766  ORF Transcript_25403/g.72766 Transcript_25403/m.72766 type:complete len:334 (+) Transcript_25403:95-1096(+)